MAWIRLCFLLVFTLLLSACASTPTQYLSLRAQGSPLPNQPLVERHRLLIVDHVQMPASIDRLYLTRRSGDNGMEVSGHVRWIAPLGGMTQRVLTEDLRRRLSDVTVLLAGSPVPDDAQPTHLRVQVQEFLPTGNGHVLLDADYFLLNAAGHVEYAGHFHHRVHADSSATAQAQAMSTCIAELAQDIARHLPAEYRANSL
ncbi:PqiC family protein [Acidithiobacillus sp. AMEEHan]|uniref:PqiC family protein n=1 Tax=Acidithiobacillus sp. AMEEHan TaxID=2994951 RepID=UPI0027E3E020|nr:PqiC family protein [Acidithiobacillus sp. AMEEHan]